MPPRFVLLFDADCGLCSFFARLVRRADLRRRIEAVPLADRRADPWFAGVGDDERFGSFHVVRPSGNRLSRGRALVAVVEALPLGAGVSRFVSGLPRALAIADALYDILVRYRDFLAGVSTESVGTSAASGSS